MLIMFIFDEEYFPPFTLSATSGYHTIQEHIFSVEDKLNKIPAGHICKRCTTTHNSASTSETRDRKQLCECYSASGAAT